MEYVIYAIILILILGINMIHILFVRGCFCGKFHTPFCRTRISDEYVFRYFVLDPFGNRRGPL